jgi:hypothetical protein
VEITGSGMPFLTIYIFYDQIKKHAACTGRKKKCLQNFCVYETDNKRLRESRRRKVKSGFIIQRISWDLNIQGVCAISFFLT